MTILAFPPDRGVLELDRKIIEAIDCAREHGVSVGYIVAVLHGHAHNVTALMCAQSSEAGK